MKNQTQALFRLKPGVVAPFLGVLLCCAMVTVVAFGVVTGGNHDPAPYEPSGVEHVTVCPSAVGHLDALMTAAQDYDRLTDCHPPTIGAGLCLTPSPAGMLQIRACSDTVADTPGCGPEQWDAVSTGARLAYMRSDAPPEVAHHVIGHVIGLGHTTAATSWMAPEPGTEPTGVRCGE